jgi:hypothetical protein
MEGDLEILIPRDTPLPHEFTCHIQRNDEQELLLYEGNYVRNEKNTLLGRYSLTNPKTSLAIHLYEDRRMTVKLDDKVVGAFLLHPDPCPVPADPRRSWLTARTEFCEFIRSTRLFVEDHMVQARVPEWAWVIEQLEWAEQILEYEVSADEFRHALHEIEQLVQPVLQKAQHHIERRPLNQDYPDQDPLDQDPLDKDSLDKDCLDKGD